MFTLPEKENREFAKKKSVFAQGIYLQHRKKLKIKGCTRVVVGYMWWDIIFWGKKKTRKC